MRGEHRLLLSLLVVAGTSTVRSEPAAGDADRSSDALEPPRSVEILGPDEPLWAAPRADAPKRGAAKRGARLPLYGRRRGPGCSGEWLLVGPVAWVCSERVRLSMRRPLPARSAARHYVDGLPHRYFFAGPNGSFGYRDLLTAEQGIPDAQLEPGFAVAIERVAQRASGEDYGFTTKRLWVPMRDFGPARPVPHSGSELTGVELSQAAWVHSDDATIHSSPGDEGQPIERFTLVELEEQRRHRGRTYWRSSDGGWLRETDLRRARPAPAPPGVGPHERWLDVDTTAQVLLAYEGTRPVFGTLVSTGRGRGKSTLATPKGEHRIWIKLLSSDMDNLEQRSANRLWAIQDVPWVMYFDRGYGLHGTFWHRSFGRVRSHGCVNLTPLDAQRIFEWTSPRLPAGWTAAFPYAYEQGTRVRVR